MNAPSGSPISKGILVLMIVIVAAFALLSIYANVQRWQRDKTETVIVTPAAPSPTASPR